MTIQFPIELPVDADVTPGSYDALVRTVLDEVGGEKWENGYRAFTQTLLTTSGTFRDRLTAAVDACINAAVGGLNDSEKAALHNSMQAVYTNALRAPANPSSPKSKAKKQGAISKVAAKLRNN